MARRFFGIAGALAIVIALAGVSVRTAIADDSNSVNLTASNWQFTTNGSAGSGQGGNYGMSSGNGMMNGGGMMGGGSSNANGGEPIIQAHVGQPMTLHLTSTQGVHGIQSDELGIPDTILLPGKTVAVTFTPKRVGTYVVHCSVPCGTGHASMAFTVRVGQ